MRNPRGYPTTEEAFSPNGYDIPTQFGPEWVIPNALTKQKDTLNLQAFDHAASLHDNR